MMAKRRTKAAFEGPKICHQVFFHVVVFFLVWFNTLRSKVTALLHEYYHNTTLILNPHYQQTHLVWH